MALLIRNLLKEVEQVPDHRVYGRVMGVQGMLVELGGIQGNQSVGDRCHIIARGGRRVTCEVVGFRNGQALMMPFQSLDGVGLGCRAEMAEAAPTIHPEEAWLGRVIDAMGHPLDAKGPLPTGEVPYQIKTTPPPAHLRNRVSGKVDLGVRALNTFLTTCKGQRLGIFAGSGVGKSSLMAMMARHTTADVTVLGLIGERGREAKEFIEDDLGPEGMKRSVVVMASSDESPLMRRQAAYTTLAVCEYFRDQGKNVLCLMDSVTRFAMAQREISLAAGEPPATKGYTPTVFAELPKLLERAGPGVDKGSITGLFTVLVEGDDHNEPIADATRAILDGHIVLDREIAERGRYPAINILRSVSRTMPDCNTEEQNIIVSKARQLMATYEDMAELIRLGAYRQGSNPGVDEAIFFHDELESFLTQKKTEHTDLETGYQLLAQILFGEPEQAEAPPEQGLPPGIPPQG